MLVTILFWIGAIIGGLILLPVIAFIVVIMGVGSLSKYPLPSLEEILQAMQKERLVKKNDVHDLESSYLSITRSESKYMGGGLGQYATRVITIWIELKGKWRCMRLDFDYPNDMYGSMEVENAVYMYDPKDAKASKDTGEVKLEGKDKERAKIIKKVVDEAFQ